MRGSRHGYLITCGPEGVIEESDTFVCSHCCRIVTVKPMCDPADGLICEQCVGKGCDPIEKKLDRIERRARLFEAMSAKGAMAYAR